MLDIFNIVFGETGSAASFFGGQWWLVGFFLILILIVYFYGKGISLEGLVLTIFAAILLLQLNEIFAIGSDLLMLIIIMITLFVGFTFYKIMER